MRKREERMRYMEQALRRKKSGRLHRAVSDSGFGFGAKNVCSKLPAAGIRTRMGIRNRVAPMMRAAAST